MCLFPCFEFSLDNHDYDAREKKRDGTAMYSMRGNDFMRDSVEEDDVNSNAERLRS
jgi:hypothetical protein